MKSDLRKAWALFCYFFRIGWFTFGGGWSIVAQIQKDWVEKENALTREDLLDMVSVGRSLPGLMVGNVVYLFGYQQAGLAGAVMALLGLSVPPIVLMIGLTFCYTRVKDNVWAAKALTGVRAAVPAIIAHAAWSLRKGAFSNRLCYGICAAAAVLSGFFGVSCVLLVVMGIAAGLIMGGLKK